MTTHNINKDCPAETLLKEISGKWKPLILKEASFGPIRFNALLKSLEGANKQSLATALKELEESGILSREVIKLKPLHVEYNLSNLGKKLLSLLQNLEEINAKS